MNISCVLTLSVIVFFFSCQQDEVEPSGFTFYEQEYELSKGFIQYDPYFGKWNIVLVSREITYDGDRMAYVGSGNVLKLWIWGASSDTKLVSRTYSSSQESIDWIVYPACDMSMPEGCSFINNNTNTTVAVKRSGDYYNLQIESGSLHVTFKGKLNDPWDAL